MRFPIIFVLPPKSRNKKLSLTGFTVWGDGRYAAVPVSLTYALKDAILIKYTNVH